MKSILLISLLLIQTVDTASPLMSALQEKYSQAEWESVFGLSEYLVARGNAEEAQQARTLQVLALLKHCQWQRAAQSISSLRNSIEKRELKALVELVISSLQRETWDEIVESKKALPTRAWGISKAELHDVDPLRLRKHVASRCNKEAK